MCKKYTTAPPHGQRVLPLGVLSHLPSLQSSCEEPGYRSHGTDWSQNILGCNGPMMTIKSSSWTDGLLIDRVEDVRLAQ